MKKISYLSLITFVMVITGVMYFDTSINILKEDVEINSWLCVILSYIIGIIPLLFTIFIANYEPELNIFQKIKKIYGKYIGFIINMIIGIILFIIGINLLFNICDFVISQFLYHTPIIVSMILIISLAVYNNIKGINVISKVAFILIILEIILFITSFLSLMPEIDIDNFYPILRDNTDNIILVTFKIFSINTLPLLIILVIPKEQITNYYNKSLIIAYIFSFIFSLLTIIETYGILGKYLVKIFEYPEYMLLKKISLFGFIQRIENIISAEWIIGSYIYISLIIYSISKSIFINKKEISKYIYILIGLLLIIMTKLIFENNTISVNFGINIFPYITGMLFPIYILIILGILFKKSSS